MSSLAKTFLPRSSFQREGSYTVLPLRFTTLDHGRYVVTSLGGEHVVVSSGPVFAARLIPLEPKDRVLAPSAMKDRQWVEFDVSSGFRVFDATDIEAVRAIGASNMSFHGWSGCQVWAEALWLHPDAPDGIQYTSDKNGEKCVALFRRAAAGRKVDGNFAGSLLSDSVFLTAMRGKGHIR